jgi:hypothetical protein
MWDGPDQPDPIEAGPAISNRQLAVRPELPRSGARREPRPAGLAAAKRQVCELADQGAPAAIEPLRCMARLYRRGGAQGSRICCCFSNLLSPKEISGELVRSRGNPAPQAKLLKQQQFRQRCSPAFVLRFCTRFKPDRLRHVAGPGSH